MNQYSIIKFYKWLSKRQLSSLYAIMRFFTSLMSVLPFLKTNRRIQRNLMYILPSNQQAKEIRKKYLHNIGCFVAEYFYNMSLSSNEILKNSSFGSVKKPPLI